MKRVLQQLGVYKKDALLCVGLTTLEVIMEILLPFITARLIAEGLEASNLSAVYRYGAVLVVMALFSLIFGATAGRFAASASSGLAANLREAIYANIQTCLLYTSDAADDMQCVDLGGRRIIKKIFFFQAEDGIRD